MSASWGVRAAPELTGEHMPRTLNIKTSIGLFDWPRAASVPSLCASVRQRGGGGLDLKGL